MRCTLCGETIEGYSAKFHHLIIDDQHAADLCPRCIDQFIRWQSANFAQLFPTRLLKKRFAKK